MAPLFKDGAQLMAQGRDLARRGDFTGAGVKFTTAAERFRKRGEAADASVATVYASLMTARPGSATPVTLRSLSGLLRSLGPTTVEVGPRPVGAEELAREVDLAALEGELTGPAAIFVGESRAIAFQQLAMGYRELGDRHLVLPELFEQRSVSAASRVPTFSALAEEARGDFLRSSDPLQAAEHFQAAHHFWRQAADEGRAQAAAAQVQGLSLRVKCWFCGRERIGHGVQVVSMRIDFDPANLRANDGTAVPSVDGNGANVYACRACGSAVRNLADDIATARVAAAEARLTAEIAALRARVAQLHGQGV